MFTKKAAAEKTGLEKAIDSLLEELDQLSGNEDAYAATADQLAKLYALKETDHKIETGRRVSPDTRALVVANVLGILIIVGYEQAHVVTSKALQLLKIR